MPAGPFTIRLGCVEDAALIVRHRHAMFSDMGYRDASWRDEMAVAFLPWLQRKMETGEYLAWFALAPDGSVAAGAGLWLTEWMPVRIGRDPRRGHIVNVYTEVPYRRLGLARRLMENILDWCRQEGIAMATLNASDEGRPLYESLGFRATNDMRMDL